MLGRSCFYTKLASPNLAIYLVVFAQRVQPLFLVVNTFLKRLFVKT